MKKNKLKTYDVPFITFLSGNNTIIINNQEEMDVLVKACQSVGLKVEPQFDYYTRLERNFSGYLCFEYDNSRGLTFYGDKKTSMDWYGSEPITVQEAFDCEKTSKVIIIDDVATTYQINSAYDLYEMYNDFAIDEGHSFDDNGTVGQIRDYYGFIYKVIPAGTYTLSDFENLAMKELL